MLLYLQNRKDTYPFESTRKGKEVGVHKQEHNLMLREQARSRNTAPSPQKNQHKQKTRDGFGWGQGVHRTDRKTNKGTNECIQLIWEK